MFHFLNEVLTFLPDHGGAPQAAHILLSRLSQWLDHNRQPAESGTERRSRELGDDVIAV